MNKPATWDQTWLAIATVIRSRSWCSRRQVGAVIVTHDQRVAAVSYNGPPRGQQVTTPCRQWCAYAASDGQRGYEWCDSIHAEANALLRADFTDISGGTMYVSSAVCMNCAKLIANSGLTRVIHLVTEETDAHRRPDDVEARLRQWGINVIRARDTAEG